MGEDLYRVMINDKVIEHDIKKGDRVSINYEKECTGTVRAITECGLFIWVDWDAHCKERLGAGWMPDSLTVMNTD
jgi:hypothetical protein